MRILHSLAHLKKSEEQPYFVGGAALGIAVLAFGLFSLAASDAYLLKRGSLAAIISSVLVDLANSDRSTNAVGGLAVSPIWTAVAQAKADDMAAKGYFAHTSPDGHDPWYWFALEGYHYSYAGE